MKGLRTMIASALIVGLMLSSVGTALAEEPTKTTAVFGEVVAKDQTGSNTGFVELKTKQGNIKVKLAVDTQYRSGNFADVSTGKKVALVANKADGTLTATKMLIVPSRPTYKHLAGIVTSASETTATVRIDGKEDGSNATFTIAIQPTAVAPAMKIKPGQHITAVISQDLRATKVKAIQVALANTNTDTKAEAVPGAAGPITSTGNKPRVKVVRSVTCVELSPELVKEVCVATPQLSREIFVDMPSEQIKAVWKNTPPELAKEIWLNMPPGLAKKIWLNSPPQVKKTWISLPPELAAEEVWLDINSEQLKQIWLNMPPQLAKEIWLNLSPELAKEVWIHTSPEQIKQIWMHLPTKDIKKIWIDMPAPKTTDAATSTTNVKPISVKPVPVKSVKKLENLKVKESKK